MYVFLRKNYKTLKIKIFAEQNSPASPTIFFRHDLIKWLKKVSKTQ
jgi:hypothetical protein